MSARSSLAATRSSGTGASSSWRWRHAMWVVSHGGPAGGPHRLHAMVARGVRRARRESDFVVVLGVLPNHRREAPGQHRAAAVPEPPAVSARVLVVIAIKIRRTLV